jgi:hypothetical protein
MRKMIIGAAVALSLLAPLAANAEQRIVTVWPRQFCGNGTTVVKSLYIKVDDGTTQSWISVPVLDAGVALYEFYKELRQNVYMIYSGNAGRFNSYSTAGSDVCGFPVLNGLIRGTP